MALAVFHWNTLKFAFLSHSFQASQSVFSSTVLWSSVLLVFSVNPFTFAPHPSQVLNGSLSLTSVTRNISGVYKCHVSNSEGNLTHSLQLQVKGQCWPVSHQATQRCFYNVKLQNLTSVETKYRISFQKQHVSSSINSSGLIAKGLEYIPSSLTEDFSLVDPLQCASTLALKKPILPPTVQCTSPSVSQH